MQHDRSSASWWRSAATTCSATERTSRESCCGSPRPPRNSACRSAPDGHDARPTSTLGTGRQQAAVETHLPKGLPGSALGVARRAGRGPATPPRRGPRWESGSSTSTAGSSRPLGLVPHREVRLPRGRVRAPQREARASPGPGSGGGNPPEGISTTDLLGIRPRRKFLLQATALTDGKEIIEGLRGRDGGSLRGKIEQSWLVTSIGAALWLGDEIRRKA